MASGVYGKTLEKLAKGTFPGAGLNGGNFGMLLLKTAPAAVASDEFVSILGSKELTAGVCTNYVRKTGLTLAATLAAGVVGIALSADVTWTALGGAANSTILGAVLYYNTGSDATSPLVAWFDIEDYTTTGVDFTLKRETAGNITLATA